MLQSCVTKGGCPIGQSAIPRASRNDRVWRVEVIARLRPSWLPVVIKEVSPDHHRAGTRGLVALVLAQAQDRVFTRETSLLVVRTLIVVLQALKHDILLPKSLNASLEGHRWPLKP